MKIKYDKRVKAIMDNATIEYENIFKNWKLTPEFLLLSILEDTQSMLNIFMYVNGLFQCYFTEIEQCKVSNGQNLEDDCYLTLMERLRNIVYDIEKVIPVEEGEEIEFYSKEMKDVLAYASTLSTKFNREELNEDCLTVAIVQYYNILWSILNKWDIDEIASSYLFNYFSEENLTEKGLSEELLEVKVLH